MNANSMGKIAMAIIGVIALSNVVLLFRSVEELRFVRTEEERRLTAARDLVHRAEHCPEEDFPDVVKKNDPWGRPLLQRQDGGKVQALVFICVGPDGIPDTTDDIVGHRNVHVDWRVTGEKLGKASVQGGRGFLKGFREEMKESTSDEPPADPAPEAPSLPESR